MQGRLRQVIAIKAANPRRALVTTVEGLSHVVAVERKKDTKLFSAAKVERNHLMPAWEKLYVYVFHRLFGTKCDKCLRSFGASDFVMRAKNKIFHLECFRCIACTKQLVPGDEFALRPDAGLFCKDCHSVVKNEENNNNTTTEAADGSGDLEDDMEDRSQDEGDDKDLLLLDADPTIHDRFADSGEWTFFLTLPQASHACSCSLLMEDRCGLECVTF